MWLYGQDPIKVNYHLVKSGGQRHCRSEDKRVLIYHVISQDHVINGSRDFIGKSAS